jgi:hypothetical protein
MAHPVLIEDEEGGNFIIQTVCQGGAHLCQSFLSSWYGMCGVARRVYRGQGRVSRGPVRWALLYHILVVMAQNRVSRVIQGDSWASLPSKEGGEGADSSLPYRHPYNPERDSGLGVLVLRSTNSRRQSLESTQSHPRIPRIRRTSTFLPPILRLRINAFSPVFSTNRTGAGTAKIK